MYRTACSAFGNDVPTNQINKTYTCHKERSLACSGSKSTLVESNVKESDVREPDHLHVELTYGIS